MLAEYLLDGDELPDEAVIDAWLRKLPLPKAAAGGTFARRVVDAVTADRTVGADELDEWYLEIEREFYDPIDFEAADGFGWQTLDLDRGPYFAYLYLLGATGALAVARRLRTGDLSAQTYREFLAAGDSEYPMTLLDRLDLNVRSGGVVEQAAEEFGRLLDAIE